MLILHLRYFAACFVAKTGCLVCIRTAYFGCSAGCAAGVSGTCALLCGSTSSSDQLPTCIFTRLPCCLFHWLHWAMHCRLRCWCIWHMWAALCQRSKQWWGCPTASLPAYPAACFIGTSWPCTTQDAAGMGPQILHTILPLTATPYMIFCIPSTICVRCKLRCWCIWRM
jgi:hypothetical protein